MRVTAICTRRLTITSSATGELCARLIPAAIRSICSGTVMGGTCFGGCLAALGLVSLGCGLGWLLRVGRLGPIRERLANGLLRPRDSALP